PVLAQSPLARVPTDPAMRDAQRVTSRCRRAPGQQSRKLAHEVDEFHHRSPPHAAYAAWSAVVEAGRADVRDGAGPGADGRRRTSGDDDDPVESTLPGGAPLRSTGSPGPLRTRNLVPRPLNERPIMSERFERSEDPYRTHTYVAGSATPRRLHTSSRACRLVRAPFVVLRVMRSRIDPCLS